LMEMLSYEKTLDSFIDLLRKDEVSLCTNFPLITCMQFTLAKHVLFLVR